MSTLHHRFFMLFVLIALTGLACNLAGGATPVPGNSSMVTSDPSMLRELPWADGSRFAYFSKAGPSGSCGSATWMAQTTPSLTRSLVTFWRLISPAKPAYTSSRALISITALV